MEFHNLGIRIEDDIFIQEEAPEILTKSCPKEVSEIETLAQQNQT
jgi:Xaa-Pro aminopeptidase